MNPIHVETNLMATFSSSSSSSSRGSSSSRNAMNVVTPTKNENDVVSVIYLLFYPQLICFRDLLSMYLFFK